MWAEYAEKAVFLYHNSALILGRNGILPPAAGRVTSGMLVQRHGILYLAISIELGEA